MLNKGCEIAYFSVFRRSIFNETTFAEPEYYKVLWLWKYEERTDPSQYELFQFYRSDVPFTCC